MFEDLLEANRYYQRRYYHPNISGVAARGLAVLTCMDSRIEPLAMMGLRVGDAKIIRTAGARVTEDGLRNLVLATNLLGAKQILLVPHTHCAMVGEEADIARRVAEASGHSTEGFNFHSHPDQMAALDIDIALIKECPLITDDVIIGGFIYDVDTGGLQQVR